MDEQESKVVDYLLYHIRAKENDDDDEKLIGIYTAEEKAKAAIQRLRGKPGFRDYPNGFEIFEHVLDRDSWTEGFISADDAVK
jgi:homoserine kinase type II